MQKRFIILFLVAVFIFTSTFVSAQFNYVINKNFVPLALQSKPAKNVNITDPDFHIDFTMLMERDSINMMS